MVVHYLACLVCVGTAGWLAVPSAGLAQQEVRIAIVPPVAILQLGRDGRLPDMKFVTAREEAAKRLGEELSARRAVGRYRIVPQSGVDALMLDFGWTPADMFNPAGPLDDMNPAQSLTGRKDEQIGLYDSIAGLRAGKPAWTSYRHTRSGTGATSYGVAVWGEDVAPMPDPRRAKKLAEALDADLLVYIQLDDVLGFVQDRARSASGDFATSYNPMWPVELTSGYPWRQLARMSRYAALTERVPYRIQIVSGADGKVIDKSSVHGDSLRPIALDGEGRASIRNRTPDEIVARAQADGLPRIIRVLAAGPRQPVFKSR